MSAPEIIGAVAASIIVGVIAGHFIQDKIFGDKGSPAQVTQAQVDAWGKKAMTHNYFQRVLCEFDIFVNVLCNGNLGETISSRTSRYIRSKKPEFFLWRWTATWVIWLCDLVQAMHGVKAESGDLFREEKVVEIEKADLGLK